MIGLDLDDPTPLTERLEQRRRRHRQRGLHVRAATMTAGILLSLTGLALLVLPGPGIPVLLAGIALLSLELRFADPLLARAHAALVKAKARRTR